MKTNINLTKQEELWEENKEEIKIGNNMENKEKSKDKEKEKAKSNWQEYMNILYAVAAS